MLGFYLFKRAFCKFFCGHCLEVVEVETSTVGLNVGASLLNVRTENLAQCCLEQMDGGVCTCDCCSAACANLSLDGINNNESIVKMGTLIIPEDILGEESFFHTESGLINGKPYLDIVAKSYYEMSDDAMSFTAVLIGIPDETEDQLNRKYVARSYVEYADGTIIYSNTCARSLADLMPS